MRFTSLLPVLFVPAIACGGGESKQPTPVDTVTPPQDTTQEAACPICGPDSPCTLANMEFTEIPGLGFLDAGADGMLGTADDAPLAANDCQDENNNPAPCDWFVIPPSGANLGKKTFFLAAGIGGDQLGPLNTGPAGSQLILGVEIVSDNNVFIAKPAGVPLVTDPAAITSISLLAAPDGTVGYEAIMYFANISGSTINSLYISTGGTLKTTEISDALNGVTKGLIENATFAETDGAVTGDCTTSMDSFEFQLTQGEAPDSKRTAPSTQSSTASNGGLRALDRARSEAIYHNIKAYLKRK